MRGVPLLSAALLGIVLLAGCVGPRLHSARLVPTEEHRLVAEWLANDPRAARHCVEVQAGLDVLGDSRDALLSCQIAVGEDRQLVDGWFLVFLDLRPEAAWRKPLGATLWGSDCLSYVVALVNPPPLLEAALASDGSVPIWLRFRYPNMLFAFTSNWVRVEPHPAEAGSG